MADAGLGGRRQWSLYFGVSLELMRVAVAPSSERTYEGHFDAWVDFRVRCCVLVFLQPCSDGCPTCGSCSSMWRTLSLPRNSGRPRSRAICLRSSFSIGFRAVSSLTPPTPFSPVPSKGLLGPTPMWVTRLPVSYTHLTLPTIYSV